MRWVRPTVLSPRAQKAWKVVSLALMGASAVALALTQVALYGSRGNLRAIIDGQLDPGPDLSGSEANGSGRPPEGDPEESTPYEVVVELDVGEAIRRVDPRFLSFAIDTSAVVGGKWWDPDAGGSESGSGSVHAPVFDFGRRRLDLLVQGLVPAYLRIGGSEADKVFYDLSEAHEAEPPPGFDSVLRKSQWDALQAFAARNGLDLVMTLNAGPATRDPTGAWQSENAAQLLNYSRERGYEVAVFELGNELNLFWYVHGLGTQVSAAQYAEDLRRLRRLVGELFPNSKVAGQAAAYWPVLGEPLQLFFGFQSGYAKASGADTDVFAWHYYPQQSRRGPIASRRAFPGRLLDPDNLDEVAYWADHNAALRDRYARGAPLWLSETGNAQFGGEPGLSDRYLASLWWMDQLGLLAVHHHDVVVRQTLAGLNYQLITDDTLEPLPDYWASVLWKRLMGTDVLRVTVEGPRKLRAYAHRTPDGEGVTLLLMNLHPARAARVTVPGLGGTPQLYALTAHDWFGTEVRLNGRRLALESDGTLPRLAGVPPGVTPAGVARFVTIGPLSFTFVTWRP